MTKPKSIKALLTEANKLARERRTGKEKATRQGNFHGFAPCGCPYQPMTKWKNEANTDHGSLCVEPKSMLVPVKRGKR